MADIQGVDLIEIVKSQPRDNGSFRTLRLVQWVVDGQSKSVKLEKRNFFLDEYGEIRTGKCEGLTIQDLEACKPHWTKIVELMKTPPPYVAPTPELDAAVATAKEALPGSEEIPF